MSEQPERKRDGLEGIAMNDYEVWGFDAARAGVGPDDVGALIVSWLLVLGTLALAVWGRSIILGAIGAIGFAIVGWWTASKIRSRIAARRMMRHIRERDARGL